MLKDAKLESYRTRLIAEREALSAENDATSEDRATVVLDQQSVGRLSRMDALQRQAMAQARARRRAGREARIKAALERLEDGEFGFCLDCGDEIARERLDLDPTFPNCLSCARG